MESTSMISSYLCIKGRVEAITKLRPNGRKKDEICRQITP